MADGTGIEWTDATWNPITGCSVVSAGCKHCYAMKLAGTRLQHHESRKGLTVDTAAGPVWTGEVRFNPQWLDQPLRWRRPRTIFVCAHGDLFHEGVTLDQLDQVFAVMALAPQHRFQVLTKRSARMREYLQDPATRTRVWARAFQSGPNPLWGLCPRGIMDLPHSWPLPNVWAGVSIENRDALVGRAMDLRDTPAAVRFWSAEPLLGDLGPIPAALLPDWVIIGGESGGGARPMHPDWARRLRDQCGVAGVPVFFKQWGGWSVVYDRDVDDPDWRRCSQVEAATPNGQWLNLAGGQGFHGERVVRVDYVGKGPAGRELDGRTWSDMPT